MPVDTIGRAPNGKVDYKRLKAYAAGPARRRSRNRLPAASYPRFVAPGGSCAQPRSQRRRPSTNARQRGRRDAARLGRAAAAPSRRRPTSRRPWVPGRRRRRSMTVSGAVTATAVLLVLLCGTAVVGWNAVEVNARRRSSSPAGSLVPMLGGIGFAIATIFQPAVGPHHRAALRPRRGPRRRRHLARLREPVRRHRPAGRRSAPSACSASCCSSTPPGSSRSPRSSARIVIMRDRRHRLVYFVRPGPQPVRRRHAVHPRHRRRRHPRQPGHRRRGRAEPQPRLRLHRAGRRGPGARSRLEWYAAFGLLSPSSGSTSRCSACCRKLRAAEPRPRARVSVGSAGAALDYRAPAMADLGFDGKVAIITGAGGGLGRSHALELAKRGALIVVNDLGGVDRRHRRLAHRRPEGRRRDQGRRRRGRRQLRLGRHARGRRQAIVQDRASTPSARVDIIINNAGILRDTSFKNMTPGPARTRCSTSTSGAPSTSPSRRGSSCATRATAGSSTPRRAPASSATSARPTTAPPRWASSASPACSPSRGPRTTSRPTPSPRSPRPA